MLCPFLLRPLCCLPIVTWDVQHGYSIKCLFALDFVNIILSEYFKNIVVILILCNMTSHWTRLWFLWTFSFCVLASFICTKGIYCPLTKLYATHDHYIHVYIKDILFKTKKYWLEYISGPYLRVFVVHRRFTVLNIL